MADIVETVSGARAMIAGMEPELAPGVFHFCACPEADRDMLLPRALASFAEPEGLSLILSSGEARAAGLPLDLPMRRITLRVHSALDGVGLTAAVSGALAGAGIPCNMVAALRHDHVFVPEADAERALAILAALSADQREGTA
ncbi:MAG: ACT domain-containing protein [Pseudooceanicola sp.]